MLIIIHGYIFQWEEFFLKNLDDALEITSFLILQAIHTPRVQKLKLSSIFCNSKSASEISLQVCGEANVWGDGVVPEMSAHLEGAINLTLDGVYHSPVGANEERPWYGTTSILDRWIHHLQQ